MPTWTEHSSKLVAIFAGACLSSYAAGFAVLYWLNRWQILDQPNHRSSHISPTLRGGGVGIMLVISIGAAVMLSSSGEWYMVGLTIGAGLSLAVVSFIDDRRSLPWHLRIGVQFVVALFAAIFLFRTVDGPDSWWWPAGVPFLIFAFVAYANAFNFMDGINGLAGSQALITGLGTALIGLAAGLPHRHPAIVLSILIAGAAGGFLPHNFPRARMFMGDVGSVPIGFQLSVLAAWITREIGNWILVPFMLLHANFLLDTGITLLRRIARGEEWREAHRQHFYQRLVQAGKSHATVTGCEILLQALTLSLILVGITIRPLSAFELTFSVLSVWTIFFLYAHIKFSKSAARTAVP